MGAHAATQWLRRRWLPLATGLAAGLPVIVSSAHAVAVDWVPLGDNAVIAARAYDVFTSHTPLLGQYSTASSLVDDSTYSPGPQEYWILALPARIFDPVALALVAGLFNLAAVVGIVLLARRRGGAPLMFATAAAVAVMSNSLGSEALHDIWNPHIALLPFALLIYLAWSIACGDFRLLPLALLVASFVAQCHLSYGPPALGLLVVAVGGLVLSRSRLPRAALRRWAVAAVAVGLVFWAPALIEQATERPGNLVLVERVARADVATAGTPAGWRAVVRSLGYPPWWLRGAQDRLARYLETGSTPGTFAIVSCLLVLAALAFLIVAGLRRSRHDVVAASAIGVILAAALASVAASTPQGVLSISITYTLLWGSPAGMFAWLTVGWGCLVVLGPRLRPLPRRAIVRARIVGLAALVCLGVVLAAAGGDDLRQDYYAQVRTVADRLEAEGVSGRVLVAVPSRSSGTDLQFDIEAAIVYALRRRGTVVAVPDLEPRFGDSYGRSGRRYDTVLYLTTERSPRLRGRLLARFEQPLSRPLVGPPKRLPDLKLMLLRASAAS
jgi:hypothetical protein